MSFSRLSALIPLLPPHKTSTPSSKTHLPSHSSFIRLREDFQSEQGERFRLSLHSRRSTCVAPVLKPKYHCSANRQEQSIRRHANAYLRARKSVRDISRTYAADSRSRGNWNGSVLWTNIILSSQKMNGRVQAVLEQDLERGVHFDVSLSTGKGSGASKMHRGVKGTTGMIPIAHSRYKSTRQHIFQASGLRVLGSSAACNKMLRHIHKPFRRIRVHLPSFAFFSQCAPHVTSAPTAVRPSILGLTHQKHIETLSHMHSLRILPQDGSNIT